MRRDGEAHGSGGGTMSSMADTAKLAGILATWSWRNGGYQVVEDVARSGSVGTELLAEEMHRRSESSERLYLAAALGYGSGGAGIEELRSAAIETGPDTTDLRCASILGLAKRLGDEATQVLALALSDRAGAVREYAMTCLAAVGDGSAYEVAFSQLRSWLKKPAKQKRGEMNAVVYLLRATEVNRVIELQDLLCEHESRINPNVKDILLQLWPSVFGTVPVTQDDAEQIRTTAWIRISSR